MRMLVVGLGSMGKRRVRNLLHLRAHHVAGFDPREDRRSEAASKYGIPVYSTIDEAMDLAKPQALVISTPPDLHLGYARLALTSSCHFFTEAGVDDEGTAELLALHRTRPHLVAAPSCTLRYNPSIRYMKKLLDDPTVGKPLLLTYHSGQWLPDWHPWEDYRSYYVSRRHTGACREIVPFELAWLTWALGPVQSISAIRGKLSSLDCNIDDAYLLILKFESGLLGNLMVDVISRSPVRQLRLLSEEATIEWDGPMKTVKLYRARDQQWETTVEPSPIHEPGYVSAENMYIDEMNDFLASCRGERPWGYSLEDDRAVVNLLLAAEKSADRAARVIVGEDSSLV